MGEDNISKNRDSQVVQEIKCLSPEEEANLKAEQQRQEALMKNLKTTEQIRKETIEKLNSVASSKGVAVAAALANSIPISTEKKPVGPIIIRKFEVTLYEEDEDERTGQIIRKVVNGGKPEIIEARSPADLEDKLNLYRRCGQHPVAKEIGQPRIIDNGKEISKEEFKQRNGVGNDQQVQQKKIPPKIYKIGGIEIKNDNGKIYQKQWMQLSESEAKNIRIVNDKTNGIVNLKGKHIEMMKWVLVENSEDDETSSLDESVK